MTERNIETGHGDKTYSITQLCREFDLTPRALRFYEQRKLLMPLRRGSTRVFTHRDRARLQFTLRGKRFGFTLTEIKEMLNLYDGPNGREDQLRKVFPRLQAQLNVLRKEQEELGQVLIELDATCSALSDSQAQLAN